MGNEATAYQGDYYSQIGKGHGAPFFFKCLKAVNVTKGEIFFFKSVATGKLLILL